jgi:glycosyltransferase involved in cell wall biosynthesis
MLEPWSLKRSRIRKWFARRLHQDAILERAGCLRATSQMEADNIRTAGFKTPIAVVPNGVTLPARPDTESRPGNRPVREALFISRLHPKKGLLNLIEAWKQVRPRDWKLTIIGPGESSYVDELRRAVAGAGLTDVIEIRGPVWGEERFRYYWAADLFVFPSFSENFAMVVAEALACEVPVITTKGLPWEDLERHRCGWWIDIGVEPLVKALRNATEISDPERQEMGRRGRKLIGKDYNWDSAAVKMTTVYRWLTGGKQPDFVQILAS